ncbi:MAG: tRNA (guanosine(37)-N1)-methyltransferase TrmD [Planctomycetota bacterium]|jgi:tRNA (guanine37-N1)-methyltransferase
MPLRIDILTLFPEMFPGVLGASILGRAVDAELVSCAVHNIRDWADNKHNKVDDRPFGGGPGMVMMCQPLCDAVAAVEAMDDRPAHRILLSPQGTPLTQSMVERLSGEARLLLIAGHYEGIDERAIEQLAPTEISVGDYVLSGGELPAMLLVDAVTRLLPGALGHADSATEDSFGEDPEDGRRLLDCPHFTRPRSFQGLDVPEVLLSGDHQAIEAWRRERRIERTRGRRPDLLDPPPGC